MNYSLILHLVTTIFDKFIYQKMNTQMEYLKYSNIMLSNIIIHYKDFEY